MCEDEAACSRLLALPQDLIAQIVLFVGHDSEHLSFLLCSCRTMHDLIMPKIGRTSITACGTRACG